MLAALGAGLMAGSSLIVGGLIALLRPVREHTLGLIMAFGAGVLISAVAYDLVLEAVEMSAGVVIPLGIAAGALTFYWGDRMIERAGGGQRKAVRTQQTVRTPETGGSPRAIVFGTVLDGVPESIVVGLSLLGGEGVSLALVAAVFLSNVPEALAATAGLASSGIRSLKIMGMWAAVTAVCGLSALAGYGLLGGAPEALSAFVLAFAAGAVLTMLADTMMPEAFEHGGEVAGLVTTLGFVLAFALAMAENPR